jgi:phage regulator Rha-like protein
MNENIISKFELVEIFENEPRISHKLIAKNTDNKEVSVGNLINKYMRNLEVFGSVHFKNELRKDENKGGDQPKIFYLNEQQATLLLTFMRNNEIVINFKVKLVKEFFEMRQLLLNSQNSQQPVQAPQTFDTFDFAKQTQQNREILEFIELINSQSPINLFFLDKIYKHFSELTLSVPYDYSPIKLLGIDLNSQYFIPTELGKFFNKSAVEVNKILEAKGFQIKIDGVWKLTENGKKYAIQLDNNFHTIKWKLESLI